MHRQRVHQALQFKQAPVPIDYLAHPLTDARLKAYYNITTEAELLDCLGADFYYLSCRDISQNESCLPYYIGPELPITPDQRTCPFGIVWTRGAGSSKFAVDEALQAPLQNAQSEADILSHRWPKPQWFDFSPLVQECQQHQQRVIVGGFWAGILGDSYRMHGFEQFLYHCALKPQLIKTLVQRMTDFYLEMNQQLFELLKGQLDIWFFGNDLGSQQGLLFSPDMFADIFYQPICQLVALAKQYNLHVMMHSCGAIAELIPLLIDAGVDILDPIQVTAAEMNPQSLKKRFGQQIVFHGGIDTQQVLPTADPQTVAQHCRETLEIMTPNGGYIFAPSQILQPDIPAENIDIMYKTARQFRTP